MNIKKNNYKFTPVKHIVIVSSFSFILFRRLLSMQDVFNQIIFRDRSKIVAHGRIKEK